MRIQLFVIRDDEKGVASGRDGAGECLLSSPSSGMSMSFVNVKSWLLQW